MGGMAEKVMRNFYRRAEGDASRLPWHREEPGRLLDVAVAARAGRGRALDLGCGAGVFLVWLAQRGMQITGIDMFAEATAMARARAQQAQVPVELVTGDLFSFNPPAPFDLVYDSGCLHSLVGGDVDAYKRKLLSWLAPGADFVLEHWGKRHALDWRPIGPRRRSQATITRMFAPELQLRETDVTDFAAPMPFGPTVRGVAYWFRRAADSK